LSAWRTLSASRQDLAFYTPGRSQHQLRCCNSYLVYDDY
jgi:hypothetical protein